MDRMRSNQNKCESRSAPRASADCDPRPDPALWHRIAMGTTSAVHPATIKLANGIRRRYHSIMPKHLINPDTLNAVKRAPEPVPHKGVPAFVPGRVGNKGGPIPGGKSHFSQPHREPLRRTGGFRGR